jgi:hypothetical protein
MVESIPDSPIKKSTKTQNNPIKEITSKITSKKQDYFFADLVNI